MENLGRVGAGDGLPKGDPKDRPVEFSHKLDPLANLETEFKRLGATVAKLKAFLDPKPATEDDTADKSKPESEAAPTSEALRKRIDELPDVLVSQGSLYEESVHSLLQDIVPQVKQLDPSPGQAITQVNEILDVATTKIVVAQAAQETEHHLSNEYSRFKELYKHTLLAEANAALGSQYQTFEQLLDAQIDMSLKARDLGRQHLGTGRFLNKVQITGLDRESQALAEFYARYTDIKSTSIQHPSVPSTPEQTLAEIKVAISKPIVEVIIARYDELHAEFQAYAPATEAPEIPEEVLNSLNTDLIDNFLMPYFYKTSQGYTAEYAADFLDPLNIQKATEIVRQSLKIRHTRSFGPSEIHTAEEVVKNDQIRHQLDQLPYSIRSAVEGFFGWQAYWWDTMEHSYKQVAGLVQATQGMEREGHLIALQRQLLDEFEGAVSGDNVPRDIREVWFRIAARGTQLDEQEAKLKPLVDNFLHHGDNRVWSNFKNNPHIRQLFGDEQLEATNQQLINTLIDQVLTLAPNSTEARKMGYSLLDFRSPETLPIIVLNAYRDPETFMFAGVPAEGTVFFKFVLELTAQQIELLKEQHIPGLVPLLELVKNNPEAQRLNSPIWDSTKNELYLNPISTEISKNLVLMSLHFIETGNHNMKGFIDSLFDSYPTSTILETFSQIQQERGELPINFSRSFMQRIRRTDRTFRVPSEEVISEETYLQFNQGFNNLLAELSNPKANKEYLTDSSILRFIARQPDRVSEAINLPSDTPYLFSVLLKEGGPLYANRFRIIENIFANGNALKRAKEIERIFSQRVPYWKQLYLFTDARIGEALATATSKYPITEVTGISIDTLLQRHRAAKQLDPDGISRLQAMISNPEVLSRIESGELINIPFTEFNGMYKRLIFRDLLKRSIETSRDLDHKSLADARNRASAAAELIISDGTYIHGSAVDVIESVLLNGNLPQEALGEGAGTDSYPFQTDFGYLTHEFLSEQPTTEAVFSTSRSGDYGKSGNLGPDGQLFYLYQRTQDSYEANKRYGPAENHSLILGGMPATEISGIVLRSPEVTLNAVSKAIFENGFYIPVYDLDGKLLFSSDDYDRLRHDLNTVVPVEIWDYSLKTGEQLGSNPGGEFTVPTEEGALRHYVKFASSQSTDQIWNEQLGDNIYRHLGIPIPDTKIVKIDTTYGHASEIIPLDNEAVRADLKNGFIVDALLANWDIVANAGNTASSEGVLMRLDNGGALLFRARGERKTGFSNIVTELESLKAMYPGLTQEDITKQIQVLQERFTDESVNQLVDSVRLSKKDRDYLKSTLKQRREYIFSYYNPETQTARPTELSEVAKVVEATLNTATLDDNAISQFVPEWTKLTGEEGYQHNRVLLGEHIKDAVTRLKQIPEYADLSDHEKNLALVATLFHDIGKPTGAKDVEVPRDFEHEIPSAQIAAEYLRKWGYSDSDIKSVIQVIINDGVASDIARGNVRDTRKNLSSLQLKAAISPSALKILRAVNRADVMATVGSEGFNTIANAYNQYFEEALSA